ncbi:MAG: OsmC family protein [bacterium]|nr:OsmC family protein [bacterium]
MPMEVRLEEKYRFVADARGHQVIVDQPVSGGGSDQGMSPVELFVASLASCVAYYAANYLERHKMPSSGLRVAAEWEFEKKPYRISKIRLTLHTPHGFPKDQQEKLLAVSKGCTVHHTLIHEPALEYEIIEG